MLATLATTSVSQVTSYVDSDDDNDILSSMLWDALNMNNFYFLFYFIF